MKQNIKIILFSCLVGSIFAGVFFLNIKNKAEAKSLPILYAFQVGVFKNETNALNTKKSYSFAKVIKDNEYYRVFIGVTVQNKEMLQEIFSQQQGYYYIKEIQVTEELYNNISKYDTLLTKASVENRLAIINNMLESMPDEL